MTGLPAPHFYDNTADLLETNEAWLGLKLQRGGRFYALIIEDGDNCASMSDLSLADLEKLGHDILALVASEKETT